MAVNIASKRSPTPSMSSPSSWDALSESEGKQAVVFFGNDVPHDDIANLFRTLQRYSKDLRCSQLAAFIALCNHNIKAEVAKLPQSLQQQVPPFETILALIDDAAFRKGPLGGAMEGVFLIIFQIGMIIGHHEVEKKPYDFSESGTVLGALGCGLLSAAATSVSSTLTDLANAGAQVVQLAFRLGVHVYETSEQLEAPLAAEKDPEPWAYVIPGISAEEVQKELDAYNEQKTNPSLTQIFISAADKTSISISGPPSRLKAALKSSDVLRYSNFFPLPVHHGLCHAPHIYSDEDVKAISGDIVAEHDVSTKLRVPLLSSNTGVAFNAANFGGLLEQVTSELLASKIHIDNIAHGIRSTFSPDSHQDCPLWTFRTSLVLKAIMASVEDGNESPSFTWKDLVKWTSQEDPARVPRTPKQSKLAVVGMSCRLPGGANDLELYWKLMSDGRDVHTTIPPDRFDLNTHYDPTGETENATQTPYMNHIDAPGMFDAGFFNMSPREAEQTDPMHRLALVTAYEALEMAGHSPNRTPSTSSSRVGTYYGQASDDWRELNGSQNIGTYSVPAGERGFANGRIQYFFKFSGPSFNMDTACSSGLAAVNAACSAVWAGECDTALAGGLNVITDPDNFCQLGKGHFLSMTGQCKVWDEAADGYCRADGVGSVVIKRLEDAEADNDNILACILAANTNHSAEAISITHPHAPTQMKNYSQVMSSAGINPLDVSYLELHGTGTQAGDREESRSVAEVFAPLNPRRRKNQRLKLGAVKSNIGHGEAAAGIASFIKVLLMYQKCSIPPQIGVKKQNPTIPADLEERNMGLNFEHSDWPRPTNGTRHAIVNSFGAHGGNTTVLLEDAPERARVGSDPRTIYPITVSARSRNSLKMNLEALSDYLQENPDIRLGDLSYTLCARRMHHPFRIGETVQDVEQLRKVLTKQIENAQSVQPVPTKAPEVAFVFTGQGVFYNSIGGQLYEQFPLFHTEVNRLDRLVKSLDLPSILPCIQNTAGDNVSPVESQVAIVVIEIALTKLWKAFGILPSAVVGHSLGEYAALTTAGVLSEIDAIYLAGARARLLTTQCDIGSHKMLSVRTSLAEIERLLDTNTDWEVSCVNGENDIVISGEAKAMEEISGVLQNANVKCTLLKLPFAFHSAQMDPILESIEDLAQDIRFREPKIPVISPLLADGVFDGKTLNGEYLRRATREPVDFLGAIEAAQELGIADSSTMWIDIGPHSVAGAFVRSITGTTKVLPTVKRDEDNFVTLSSSLTALHLEGLPVSWNQYYRPYEKAHKLLHLKSYRWNEKNYWIPYLGTWTLDKAHIKDNLAKLTNQPSGTFIGSRLKTSLIHGIVHENIEGSIATLTTVSNMLDPAFLEAVQGHMMNGHAVATSSIWADMAWTVGRYLYQRAFPKSSEPHMNVANMDILHAQIAKGKSGTQLLQLEAELNLDTRSMSIYLYNLSDDGTRSPEHYGSCSVLLEDSNSWSKEWKRTEHLVTERIQSLSSLAKEGKANALTRNMAYELFKNVVDYADRYRGMQHVIIRDYEACARSKLTPEEHGVWHTPPHWIDSVAHLAGLVMNGSDASNTEDYFYVTPGWDGMRFIKPLEGGASYDIYVKMSPTEETNMFAGDVYILQGETIVGMVDQIKFRKVPRVLMNKFFSPPSGDQPHGQDQTSAQAAPSTHTKAEPTKAPAIKAPTPVVESASKETKEVPAPKATVQQSTTEETNPPEAAATQSADAAPASSDNPTISGAIDLIAHETGMDASELTDSTIFAQIGVDSLMSLVLAEKFKSQLQVSIQSSLFLECTTVGELATWLEDNR